MIEIKKGAEPEGLDYFRREAAENGLSPREAYESLTKEIKDQIKESLLNEQGHLCVYCMCKIPRTDSPSLRVGVTIEHLIPVNPSPYRDVGQGLDYNNLFAVCSGNRSADTSRPHRDLTCDAYKENKEFRKVNPCMQETLASIFYELDGRIDANDPDIAYDLTEILNLNCANAPLIAERKATLNGLIEDMGRVEEEALLTYCQEILTSYQTETNPKTPYVGILIWYLQSMIKSLSM